VCGLQGGLLGGGGFPVWVDVDFVAVSIVAVGGVAGVAGVVWLGVVWLRLARRRKWYG
jgi:hypothetical protein